MARRLVVGACVTLLLVSSGHASAYVSVVGRRTVVAGLDTFLIKLPHPNVVHVAEVQPDSALRLKIATTKWPADNRASTSYLCGRCLIAVNGGFFSFATGLPVAGQWPAALSALLDNERRPTAHKVSWLMKDGITWPFAKDSFTLGRHPRTFVFGNRVGTIWFAAVDGRQPGYSLGMTLPEIVSLARNFGANWVVNLDGGCSTTFVVGGVVKNSPCQDETTLDGERPVANAFVVLRPVPEPVPN